MKIFISSARKGLEEERDCLKGLIEAAGHEPVRFEEFSAQPTPSREACLEALSGADACLILLGPRYGHTFPETGQSATHDEWVAAGNRGIPRLVYRKENVEFEPAQHAFVQKVEAYATGVFRDTFAATAELQTKIVAKLRELAATASPLVFQRLAESANLHWGLEKDGASPWTGIATPRLLLHVLPVGFQGYSGRQLEQFGTSLPSRIRGSERVSHDVSLTVSSTTDPATVHIPPSSSGSHNKPKRGTLTHVRLHKSGQLTVEASLPRDSLGWILDPDDLPQQLTELMQFIGALNLVQHEPIVVAAAVSDAASASIARFDPHQSRSSASFPPSTRTKLQTEPDESVTLAALTTGAREVATLLARMLISQRRSTT
ncbi:DUF4062 domain-containing protein [Streptomyces anulatus]|uniref:DUF4062 domain-containing protein n=1 Tax=Streptomyces anulatus TaxID=1892 RepID=UPI0033D045CB